MNHARIIALAILMGLGAAPVAAAESGNGDSPPAVYTAAQASAGATVFTQACAECHGKDMQGLVGPALKGDQFRQMAAAQDLTADALLTVVSLTMPQNDPASLTPDQYNQVVAYILQQNQFPAGNTPLAPGAPALKTLHLK